jgi:hypothetical protein
MPERCRYCGRELSSLPVATKPLGLHKNLLNSLLDVRTASQVVTFLLMATVARIIFGDQPFRPEELQFLSAAFGMSGAVTGILYLIDRWKDQ